MSSIELIDKLSPIVEVLNRGEWMPYNEEVSDFNAVRCADGTVFHVTREWLGGTPDRCEISGEEITDRFVDGATKYGPWAIMHPDTHATLGCGLGEGKGQMYQKVGDSWIKITPAKVAVR